MKARSAHVLALAALALALVAEAPAGASAAVGAEAQLTFDPARLGAATTITTAFRIGSAQRSPLTSVELRLPAGIGAQTSMLGLATCNAAALTSGGPGECPPNSLLGYGSATVSVPLGAGSIFEHIAITIFMAPAVEEHTTLLFYARGTSPIISQLVFQGALLNDSGAFGSTLDTAFPPIMGLPGAPSVSLLSMRTELGPKGLKYYKRLHGALVAYSPEGFRLPARCPRDGFPFAAEFTFADGSRESASSRTQCPR